MLSPTDPAARTLQLSGRKAREPYRVQPAVQSLDGSTAPLTSTLRPVSLFSQSKHFSFAAKVNLRYYRNITQL